MNISPIQYRLHRPMIDLGEIDESSATLPIIALDYDKRALLEGRDYPHLHVISGAYTRTLLVQHLGLPSFDVDRPEDLPVEHRTEAWQKLVRNVEAFSDLDIAVQLRTLALLRRLCFYPSILQLTAGITKTDPQNNQEAMLLYEHVLARYILGIDGLVEYDTNLAIAAAKKAPIGSEAAAHLWYISCQQYVKYERNTDRLLSALKQYKAAVHALKGKIPDNVYLEFKSRYHRFAVFSPQLQRDHEGMSAQMRLAEECAESIAVEEGNPISQVVKESVLFPLLESRIKEAMIREQWGLAQARAERLIAISPYSSMAHMHYAQVLAETEQYSKAGQEYLISGKLHPMKAEIAYFMAGQCEQQEGRIEQALAYYFESLKYDSYGVSTIECIIEIATLQNDRLLLDWAQDYMTQLEGEDNEVANGLMPYQGRVFGVEAQMEKAS